MKRILLILPVAALLCGCTISSEGVDNSKLPPAVQGSNDAQGNPISVPGAGMGVGAGTPGAPGAAGIGTGR
jgi:hypothetical protein